LDGSGRASPVEFRGFAVKCLAAAGAVDRSGLAQGIPEITSAGALGFQGVLTADNAVLVVLEIRAKPPANGAALSD